MGDHFRRSKWFGIGGVIAVAIITAAIALAFGDGADPKGATIAILAIVFVFVAALMVVQRRDLDRAQAATEREAIAPSTPIGDPAGVLPAALLSALAVHPIDQEAIEAQGAGFEIARESMRPGPILLGLIVLAMVPWQVFQQVWSIYVFVPIIVVYAGDLASRAVGAGGLVDRGFEASAKGVAPLGLEMLEHPQVGLRRRFGRPGFDSELVGTLSYAGRRLGRSVTVRRDGSGPTVTRVGGTVERRKDTGGDWLRDLWLAERLADRLAD